MKTRLLIQGVIQNLTGYQSINSCNKTIFTRGIQEIYKRYTRNLQEKLK